MSLNRDMLRRWSAALVEQNRVLIELMAEMEAETWLTAQEAADESGLTKDMIRYAGECGRVRVRRESAKKVFYLASDVDRLAEERKRKRGQLGAANEEKAPTADREGCRQVSAGIVVVDRIPEERGCYQYCIHSLRDSGAGRALRDGRS